MVVDAQETRFAEPEGSAPPGALVRPRPSRAPPAPQEEAPEDGWLPDIPWDEGDGDAGPPDHWGCGDIQYYAWKEEDEQRKAGCTEKEIREQDQMMEEELRTRALRLGALGSVARARERWAAELDDDA